MTDRERIDVADEADGRTADVETAAVAPCAPALHALRLRVFTVAWALAALFHLAGNARPAFAPTTSMTVAVPLALGLVALGALWRPGSRGLRWALCALVPISAYVEAPVVGNHWVLAAAISLALLIADLVARRRTGGGSADTWRSFAPSARAVLLTAYAFAAFAKLNSGFFDPSVSCAVYYQDQLVRSWGFGVLSVVDFPALGRATAVAASVTELSVPLLLFFRRTRRAGLLLALTFHWMLALDLSQHFWDFTAVLFAGFMLFLDDAQVLALRQQWTSLTSQIGSFVRGLLIAAGVLLALTATMAGASDRSSLPAAPLGVLVGHLAWVVGGTAVLLAVVVATLRTAADPQTTILRAPHPALLVVPCLVAFNGLTPYLEIKTGFGWNMYSNLRTVAGESNHFLVRSTLPLTDLQSQTVRILESSDPELERLAREDYALVTSEFREYLSAFPETSVRYELDGAVHARAGRPESEADRPEVSEVSRRLQAFRPVDLSGTERCVPVFSPAR